MVEPTGFERVVVAVGFTVLVLALLGLLGCIGFGVYQVLQG